MSLFGRPAGSISSPLSFCIHISEPVLAQLNVLAGAGLLMPEVLSIVVLPGNQIGTLEYLTRCKYSQSRSKFDGGIQRKQPVLMVERVKRSGWKAVGKYIRDRMPGSLSTSPSSVLARYGQSRADPRSKRNLLVPHNVVHDLVLVAPNRYVLCTHTQGEKYCWGLVDYCLG